MSLQEVAVRLKSRTYKAFIGDGLVSQMTDCLKKWPSQKGVVVFDDQLIEAKTLTVRELRRQGWDIVEIPVRAGEALKDIQAIWPLYEKLMQAQLDRWSVIFALGGGSVGDAVGFVASTYMRGVAWVGLPTTLLAQVDSCLGGKTGINHPAGKNLIGTFYQPWAIFCELKFLKTLSNRELISGFAEAIKYGIVYDKKFFLECKKIWPELLKRSKNGALKVEVFAPLVHRSLYWKSKAVAADELDLKGVREVLNFGHTFGHALEKVTGYQFFQHGEAILIGMKFAVLLSLQKKVLQEKVGSVILDFLQQIPVPALPENIKWTDLLSPMKKDKKNKDGKIKFVLLKDFGKTQVQESVSEAELLQCYETFQQLISAR